MDPVEFGCFLSFASVFFSGGFHEDQTHAATAFDERGADTPRADDPSDGGANGVADGGADGYRQIGPETHEEVVVQWHTVVAQWHATHVEAAASAHWILGRFSDEECGTVAQSCILSPRVALSLTVLRGMGASDLARVATCLFSFRSRTDGPGLCRVRILTQRLRLPPLPTQPYSASYSGS